jgi:hypothetical protein
MTEIMFECLREFWDGRSITDIKKKCNVLQSIDSSYS